MMQLNVWDRIELATGLLTKFKFLQRSGANGKGFIGIKWQQGILG